MAKKFLIILYEQTTNNVNAYTSNLTIFFQQKKKINKNILSVAFKKYSFCMCMVHIAPVQFVISLWLSFLIYFHALIASFYVDVYLVDHNVDEGRNNCRHLDY